MKTDPEAVKADLEALAVNCDLLAHCCREITRLTTALGMKKMQGAMATVTPQTFDAIAEECRKHADSL